jgi:uncharacterized protein YlxP (DUF503 family)
MPVGLLTLELHLPYAHSLKEKRLVIRRLQERLRARFNVAVSELDHQDLWQRSLIGVAALASDNSVVEATLRSVDEEAISLFPSEIVRSEMTLL